MKREKRETAALHTSTLHLHSLTWLSARLSKMIGRHYTAFISPSCGREHSNVRGHKQVHHSLVTCLHGTQLGYLPMPTSARFPAHCLPHLFPKLLLFGFPPAAIEEAMLLHLGCRSSPPLTLIVLAVSESFQVSSPGRMPTLQFVEPGSQ